MKIAFATDDQATISAHLGRAQGFQVIELKNGEILRQEYRENPPHSHARGHRAQQILEILRDCEVIVTRGIGTPAYQILTKAGKEVIVTPVREIQEALTKWREGQLPHDPHRIHPHHHGHHSHEHEEEGHDS